MSGAIKSGMPIPVPLLAALTAVLAATIVYGVFYSKITKNTPLGLPALLQYPYALLPY